MIDFNAREAPSRQQRVRIAREWDRRSFRGLAFYSVVGFLFMLLAVVYCWERHSVRLHGYQIERLKKEQATADELYRKLLLDRAALRSPQRIDAYARQYLGLVSPPSQQVIFRHQKERSNSQDNLLALDRVIGARQ